MDLGVFEMAVLKVICDYGIIGSMALERSLLAANPPVVTGYSTDRLLDTLMDLVNAEYLAYESLPGELPAFSLLPAGAQALGRPARPLPARPEDRWVKTLEADLRVSASSLNAHLTLNLAPHRGSLCKWYENQHFELEPDKFLDPAEPVRPPGLHEKVWSLRQHEHARECAIRQIYREKVAGGVTRWFDGLLAEVTSAVEAPRYFVISRTGRLTAVLFRTRLTLPKTWSRQMKVLALMDKILVLPADDLVEQYDEQTDADVEAPSFDGGNIMMPRRIEIVSPVRFHAVAERFSD